jgi:predicted ribosome quality control (RQC) complex YloA/Tae2 family protein
MKQLHSSEIASLTQELQFLLDSKVQNVVVSEKGLGLELFKASKISYLWFELDPPAPYILHFDHLPRVIKLKKSAPILLFLKAHFVGKRISQIQQIKDLGRVIELEFGYDHPLKLEVRLFPHGTNAIAHFERKKISFNKIKEMKTSEAENSDPNISIPNSRSLEVITQEWLETKTSPKIASKIDPLVIQEKEIQKKQKTLQKMQERLNELQNDAWTKLGHWLKENQSLKVPEEFKKHIDLKMSFSQNLQNSFGKAKKNQEKISGTLERIEILKNEIIKLKETEISQFGSTHKKPLRVDRGKIWKGYRLELNEKLEAFVGKSAAENLNILRFAQSWDYWVHIKDYPGAHGIIRRTRNYEVSDEEFKAIAQFIASKSKKSAHFLGPNDAFDVLIAECRYVRPIKGDKLGRVNYSNERVLHCRMKLTGPTLSPRIIR